MTSTKPAAINKATNVSIGILWTLIIGVTTTVGGGGYYVSRLNSAVEAAGQQVYAVGVKIDEVKDAVDRLHVTQDENGKALAILETLVRTLDTRLTRLEDK